MTTNPETASALDLVSATRYEQSPGHSVAFSVGASQWKSPHAIAHVEIGQSAGQLRRDGGPTPTRWVQLATSSGIRPAGSPKQRDLHAEAITIVRFR